MLEIPRVHRFKVLARLRPLAFLACLAITPAALSQSAEPSPAPPASADLPDAPQSTQNPAPAAAPAAQNTQQNTSLEGKQTKRILGIVPNFRSVSVNMKLPPQSYKEKFVGATEDSFDYSSFVFVGILAGVAQAEGSYPEFHTGAPAYLRYYWHSYVDQTDENFQVEFLLPSLLHQDPRYYTLGSGGILKRTAYSFSRVLITRTDAGHESFNASEIIGAGGAAGVSDLYYPSQERTWTKTGQRWLINVSLDGATFIFKEFWPDVNNKFFHEKE